MSRDVLRAVVAANLNERLAKVEAETCELASWLREIALRAGRDDLAAEFAGVRERLLSGPATEQR
jgi:hypothetical protein